MSDEHPTGNPAVRGAALGFALAGFGLLIAAQILPWASATTTPLQQDFPTTTGGRIEAGLAQLPVPHEMFNLGWLVVLAAVTTALAVRPAARRVVVAAGLGLIAGQLAMLVGITYEIKHPSNTAGLVSSGLVLRFLTPQQLDIGVYCAYAALVLFTGAMLFAGGVPPRLRGPGPARDVADGMGPADLTVTSDPLVLPQRQADIEVGGRPPER
ncbi:MAG TPA: hypothetical protein VGP31_13210 [Planosporangium sp.]|jgi:hypothetical protein|nr:hypothetical protein [Planosporangium sp.]